MHHEKPRPAPRRIPWSDWANGNAWELVPGEDHEQPCRDALRAARMWARDHGYWVRADLPKVGAPFETPWRIRFEPREGGQVGT